MGGFAAPVVTQLHFPVTPGRCAASNPESTLQRFPCLKVDSGFVSFAHAPE